MIDSIRYWDQQDMVPDRRKKQRAQDYAQSFQADLLSSMTGKLSPAGLPSGFDDLDGSTVPGLMQVNVDGIEKVWAEQLKNGTSFLNFSQADDKKPTKLSGLNGMLDMSVQVHMLRAKKHLERQKKEVGLDERVDKTDHGLEQSLQQIKQQLQGLAQKYDVTLSQLGHRLDLEG